MHRFYPCLDWCLYLFAMLSHAMGALNSKQSVFTFAYMKLNIVARLSIFLFFFLCTRRRRTRLPISLSIASSSLCVCFAFIFHVACHTVANRSDHKQTPKCVQCAPLNPLTSPPSSHQSIHVRVIKIITLARLAANTVKLFTLLCAQSTLRRLQSISDTECLFKCSVPNRAISSRPGPWPTRQVF